MQAALTDRVPEVMDEIERRRAMVWVATHSYTNALARAIRVQVRTRDPLQQKAGTAAHELLRRGFVPVHPRAATSLARSPPGPKASSITSPEQRRKHDEVSTSLRNAR